MGAFLGAIYLSLILGLALGDVTKAINANTAAIDAAAKVCHAR